MYNKTVLNMATVGLVGFMAVAIVFMDIRLIEWVGPLPGGMTIDPMEVVVMAVPFNLGLLMFLWFVWWVIPHQRQFDPTWRGVIVNTPRGARARLNPMMRMALVWTVLICAGFLGIFACGFNLRQNPIPVEERSRLFPGPLSAIILCAVGGCAAFAVWRREPLVGFVQDDTTAGTLSWRKSGGLKVRDGAVVRRWVTAVSVQQVLFPPHGWRVGMVVIHWTSEEERRMADGIAEYHNPADAEALADWLRDRLGVGKARHPPAASPTR